MNSGLRSVLPCISKFKISRRGRKLQATDEQRTLAALPKDVPERTWAEVLHKEDNELFIFEIREDILDAALKICYERYMEKQNTLFTVHCAAQAWLKLIDWHFYRHDPGEDPSSYPPCYIPKRRESWIPDRPPDPSPKDTWCKQDLPVMEDTADEGLQKWPSSHSLDLPLVEEIPSEYRFPGKIAVPDDRYRTRRHVSEVASAESTDYATSTSEELANESEVLQKVTDYSTEGLTPKVSGVSALKTTTPVDGSLRGAGDSVVDRQRPKLRRHSEKSKVFSKPRYCGGPDNEICHFMLARSRGILPPLDIEGSRSQISRISDCRLRNLRLDTQYEVSSEKIDTPPGGVMRKK